MTDTNIVFVIIFRNLLDFLFLLSIIILIENKSRVCKEQFMIRILFQGDSITDGNRYKDPSTRWDLNHQIGHSYAYLIAAHFGRKYPGKYYFINRGVSGDCIDKAAKRWEADTLGEHPDVLSVLLGINEQANRDGNYPEGAEAHLEHFDKTYRELLDSAREQNPALKLVILEPFFLPVGKYIEHYHDFMKVFVRKQAIIKKIAEDYGAIFIPIQKRLEALVEEYAPILKANGCDTDPNAYWLWDGVHPTEAMQGFIAELWIEATKDLMC